MILSITRTAWIALRRDRAALALTFVLPLAFFTIFALIFGGQHNSTPRVTAILVDQDQSDGSRLLAAALQRENSLQILTTHTVAGQKNVAYDAASAEAAVKAGDAPVALILPKGFGAHPVSFGPQNAGVAIEMLNDASDPIAPQVVAGLLQKAAMTSMPLTMAEQGMNYAGRYLGGFTSAQKKRMDEALAALRLEQLRRRSDPGAGQAADSGDFAGIVKVQKRTVVGQAQNNNIVSFYAAAIGVMFLLFTASGSAGSLLDEAESGALDRVLSSRVTLDTLLAGKLFYNTLLAFVQLVVMYLWAWSLFKVDFFAHIPGFVVMGICSSLAVAAFGLLLASLCHTRAQLSAVSTLLILMMSAVGGSMFPRYLMPVAVQKAGLFTINAWAIDGFTKVFWRDLPITALWPQVSVLLAAAAVMFLLARRIARRWEYA